VLYNLSFGHTSPMTVLPYGAIAEIDCTQSSFSILESGVL
jgi:muramoyltetrapeptide carboxypeptidase LdcA involved in peptidoglycan recycling